MAIIYYQTLLLSLVAVLSLVAWMAKKLRRITTQPKLNLSAVVESLAVKEALEAGK